MQNVKFLWAKLTRKFSSRFAACANLSTGRGAECKGSFDGQACRNPKLMRKFSGRFAACANTGHAAECKVLLIARTAQDCSYLVWQHPCLARFSMKWLLFGKKALKGASHLWIWRFGCFKLQVWNFWPDGLAQGAQTKISEQWHVTWKNMCRWFRALVKCRCFVSVCECRGCTDNEQLTKKYLCAKRLGNWWRHKAMIG